MAAAYTELGVASELLAIVGELGHEIPTESFSRITAERADRPVLCYDAVPTAEQRDLNVTQRQRLDALTRCWK